MTLISGAWMARHIDRSNAKKRWKLAIQALLASGWGIRHLWVGTEVPSFEEWIVDFLGFEGRYELLTIGRGGGALPFVPLDIPGFGFIYVDGCDHTNTRWIWTANGTGAAYATLFDLANPGDGLFQGVFSSIVSATRPHKYDVFQLARSTGSTTSIAQVTLTTGGGPCVFAASAIVQPG